MTPNKLSCFRAQTWHGDELAAEITGLSYDAARHLAQAATITGHTGRLMSETEDYCEVYAPDGARVGTFAETTLVKGA